MLPWIKCDHLVFSNPILSDHKLIHSQVGPTWFPILRNTSLKLTLSWTCCAEAVYAVSENSFLRRLMHCFRPVIVELFQICTIICFPVFWATVIILHVMRSVLRIVCAVCMSDLPSSLKFSVQCPLSFSLRLDMQKLKWYNSSCNLLLRSVCSILPVFTYHTLPCSQESLHLNYCMHERATRNSYKPDHGVFFFFESDQGRNRDTRRKCITQLHL